MEVMNVLLVDDREENLLALETLLRMPGLRAHKARSGVEALELLLQHNFALALIDVQMPEMDGFELAELMRGPERTRGVPIIFVTAGAHSRLSTFRGYESGAVDFLYKPLDSVIVKSKVQVFLELARKSKQVADQLEATQQVLTERDTALREAGEALQSRDEFLSIASHELKTPLTSLLLQLQLMSRSMKRISGSAEEGQLETFRLQADRFVDGLKVCERQSNKLSALLNELLDLTRIRLGRLELAREDVDVARLIRELVDRFGNEASRSHSPIELEAPDSLPVKVDPLRIEQVVANLISNAIKYGDGKPIHVKLTESGHSFVLAVRDQGIGIPPELQEKIFERFERAIRSDHISGLGLGLYISRQIVEAHGGQISVESRLGQGSVFTIRVPRQLETQPVPDNVEPLRQRTN